MLKCNLNKENNSAKILVEGTGLEMLADLIYLIRHVYTAIKADDPIMGNVFKDIMQRVIADDDSPVWGRLEESAENGGGEDGE